MGILFGFAALIILYLVGGMGAGDVKLMAALGAWLGMPLTFYVFIASSLAAGIYSICYMVVLTGKVGETMVNLHIFGCDWRPSAATWAPTIGSRRRFCGPTAAAASFRLPPWWRSASSPRFCGFATTCCTDRQVLRPRVSG